MQYRIGDRDPVTGLYDVIWPDGSATRNGIKIFNSEDQFGDVVQVTKRSDGMMIVDGAKATFTVAATRDLGVLKFGEQPVGYLNGQVFNNEDEVILPTVSIDFAPGSPTELGANDGEFVIRIKIDRPQRRDLRVKCELSGTAVIDDYTVAGLTDLIAIIPAGTLYFDVVITPIENSLGENETVVIEIVQYSGYRIGQNSASATITAGDGPELTLVQLNTFIDWGLPGETVYTPAFRIARTNSVTEEPLQFYFVFNFDDITFTQLINDYNGLTYPSTQGSLGYGFFISDDPIPGTPRYYSILTMADFYSYPNSTDDVIFTNRNIFGEENTGDGWVDLGFLPSTVTVFLVPFNSAVEIYPITSWSVPLMYRGQDYD